MIPHSRPWIDERDVAAVDKTLWSGMLGQGTRTAVLEARIAAWLGATGAVAAGSGSAAIVLALRAMDVSGGDEVVVPTYVCRSVAEAVLAVGATPRFCDSGPDWMIGPAGASEAMNALTKAIIVPHLYGLFADTAAIRLACRVPVIEDFAQAFPAERRRRLAGDLGIVSFHPTKCLTAGEGGVAVSASAEVVERMRRLRDGEPKVLAGRLFSPLSDVAATFATSQLERYDEFLEKRDAIARLYAAELAPACSAGLPRAVIEDSMHFRFTLRVPGGVEAVQEAFSAEGIAVRRGVDEMLHRLRGESDANFPVAVHDFEQTVSLPIHPSMPMEEARRVACAAARILGPRYGP